MRSWRADWEHKEVVPSARWRPPQTALPSFSVPSSTPTERAPSQRALAGHQRGRLRGVRRTLSALEAGPACQHPLVQARR